jgi:lipopolysaccharide export system permease protein
MSSMGGVALLALTLIVVVTLLVRILGRAAVGRIDHEAVFPFIGFGMLNLLPVLLSMALFLAVFLTLTRLWQDSEMVVWQGAGLGPLAWLSPVLRFALPIALLIAALSLFVIPWAAQKRSDFERVLASRDETSVISAGMFAEAGGGKRVFFVESIDTRSGQVRNIFIRSVQSGRDGVIVAQDGQVEVMDNGDRFLVLSKGRRYEGSPGAADYRMMEFDRYAVRMDRVAVERQARTPRTTSTADLLRDPTPANQAEWAMRLGYPISALLLAVFAIPASHINPRAGRSLNVLFALLTYTVYSNLMGLSEAWINQQKLSFTTSMLLVHGSMAVLVIWLYWRRLRGPAGGLV